MIDGLKFDLRIYCLVSSCDPLKIYIFHEGLARFATIKYKYSTKQKALTMMHLTNYAINKWSKNFVKGEGEEDDSASKRSIASIMKSIEEEYGVKKEIIWESIKDIIIKTVISAQPELTHIYRSSQQTDKFGKVCF